MNGIWRAECEFLRGSANLKKEKCIKSNIHCVRLSTSRNDDYVVTPYFISWNDRCTYTYIVNQNQCAFVGLPHKFKYSLMHRYGTYNNRLTIHKILKRFKLFKGHQFVLLKIWKWGCLNQICSTANIGPERKLLFSGYSFNAQNVQKASF